MARGLRDLRQKIKGIRSTRQVTKAMELVSASKMRKAIQNALTLRRYSLTAWDILQRLALQSNESHRALTETPVQNVLVIMFSPDRGLAGNLNAQLARLVTNYLKNLQALPGFQKVSFIASGRKCQQLLARLQQNVVAAFPAFSNNPAFRDILPIARIALEGFKNSAYDQVTLLYPDFVSVLLQQPTAKVILPLSRSNLRDMIENLTPRRTDKKPAPADRLNNLHAQYIFEPSAEEVLEAILPQITELQIYQAVLEAAASEHSARMVAMRSATDNATDLIADLTLTYNQTRQEAITGELAELSASKAALEG